MTASSLVVLAMLAAQSPMAGGYDPLALPKLDPKAVVAALDVRSMPLGTVLNAIAESSGVRLSYDPAVTNLTALTTVKLSNSTAEDALHLVLDRNQLAFRVLFPKAVIIYPDTPAAGNMLSRRRRSRGCFGNGMTG